MTLKTMADREIINLIKRITLEEAGRLGVEVERIILFGSRARGEAKPDSDYDILIVVKGEIDWRKKRLLWRNIYNQLRSLLKRPIDLVIETSSYYREMLEEETSFEAIITGEGIHVQSYVQVA